ncbi:MAG TPA: hypothetical protein VIP28_08020 [Nocardioides sp.]
MADRAKHLVQPPSLVSTGWPRVRDTCNNLGWEFDPWQDDLGRLILGKDSEGMYAASICAMSLPRQVGKTYLVGCLAFVLCMVQPGTLVIWTAHRGRTATETFRSMKAKARTPEMAPYIDQRPKGGGIRSSNGEQEIEFLNGSRILFGARESGFGLGFAGVGMLVIDEVQRALPKTMEDLLPTTNAAVNPLVLCMGTPPRPTDDGEVFSMLRTDAIRGDSEDVLYVELGASKRFDLEDEVEFWRQLQQVNPAFPHRVGERAILRNKKGLGEDSVFREVFGLWDEITKQFSPINGAMWEAGADVGPPNDAKPDGFAVDMSHDRSISVAACWIEEDSAHVEEVWGGTDEAAAVDWIEAAWRRAGRRKIVMIDSFSAASSMIPTLLERGVKVKSGTPGDMVKACGMVASEVEGGRLTHADQESVNNARRDVRKRTIRNSGGWGYDRSDPSAYIAPMVAVTLARLAATMGRTSTNRRGTGKVVVH